MKTGKDFTTCSYRDSRSVLHKNAKTKSLYIKVKKRPSFYVLFHYFIFHLLHKNFYFFSKKTIVDPEGNSSG